MAETAIQSPRNSTVGIIPARIGSEEVHAKVLVDLGGKPVIQHVYERAVASGALDRVLIAADDARIIDVAKAFGAPVCQTKLNHVCGTDRCAEAAAAVFPEADFIVNIQADEPFLNPKMIPLVAAFLKENSEWDITTLCYQARDAEPDSEFAVKIARASSGRAIYFSRANIPYPRYPDRARAVRHIGVYGFRASALRRFADLGPSPLELAEGLEQLRALEAEMRIQVIETDLEYARISIDTQDDIDRARQWLEASAS